MIYFLIIAVAFANPFDQKFESNVLDQRLCLSVVTGFDYLSHSLSRIMERYIEFYNHPEKFDHLFKKRNRQRKRLESFIDDKLESKDKLGILNQDGSKLILDYPIVINSKDIKSTLSLNLQIDFYKENDNWKVGLSYSKMSKFESFWCRLEKEIETKDKLWC